MKIPDVLRSVKIGDPYEDIDECIVLEEGVKFFRASKRLNMYIERLRRKGLPELEPLIKLTSKAAVEFGEIEGKHERGEITRSQARIRIANLTRHYNALLKEVKKDDIKRMLKTAGLIILIGGIIASILFGLHPFASLAIALPSLESLKKTLIAGSDLLLEPLRDEIVHQYQAIKRVFAGKIKVEIPRRKETSHSPEEVKI